MDNEEFVFFCRLNDLLEKIDLDHLRGRIMRETDDQHLRLGPGLADRFVEIAEKLLAGSQRNATQVAAG